MALKTITFGPKEFLQGVSPLQQFPNTIGGFFATGTAIDYYRFPGILQPGALGVSFTGATITEQAKALQITTSSNGYLLSTAKLYLFNPTNHQIINNAYFPHTLSGVTVSYPHSIIRATVYFGGSNQTEDIFFTDDDIGVTDGAITTTEAWGSTVPVNASKLLTGVHRACVFNGLIYFTNSTYVGLYDYTTGTHGTLSQFKLAMPNGYIAKDIFVLGNSLQIVADNGVQSIVITWDGVSTLADSIDNLDDSTALGAQTVEGFPHIMTTGRGYGSVIRKKNYFGYPQVQTISGNFNQGTISSANGQLFLGDTYTNSVWSYGTPFAQYSYRGLETQGAFPESLSNPFRPTGTIDCLTQGISEMLIASHNGGAYYLEYFQFANTSYNNQHAQFRTNDFQLPNDSTIEQIIFYSNYLQPNAAFTPSLVVDGNTIAWNGEDMTASTLDANGKSKTYFVGGILADMIAISGSWSNSTSNTVTVPINRIDVIFNTK